MTPVYPETCSNTSKLGTVRELVCFLPIGHQAAGDRAHWDAVDRIWWMSEDEYASLNPQ